jgi:hypothetical protein
MGVLLLQDGDIGVTLSAPGGAIAPGETSSAFVGMLIAAQWQAYCNSKSRTCGTLCRF